MENTLTAEIKRLLGLIPEGTVRVSFAGRHSKSVQGGDNFTRTLGEKGIAMCERNRPFYLELMTNLADKYGGLNASCSDYPRSLLTTFLLTHAEQIKTNPTLRIMASLKKIDGGNWILQQKEACKKVPEMVQTVWTTDALRKGQPFETDAEQYHDWILEGNQSKFAFLHEIACSGAARHYVDTNELGLMECEGFLFCIDADDKVIKVIKVVPVAEDGK